jgi:hypothetical protein
MAKSRGDRFDQVVDFVRSQYGDSAATIVERSIDSLSVPTRTSIGDALSIQSDVKGKDKRNGLRTLLYLLFAEGGQPVALAQAFKGRYGFLSLPALINEIRGRLPLFDNSPNRDLWDPSNFTRVTRSGPAPGRFQYIVFGMMNTYTGRGKSYSEILNDPDILKSFALSTTIIDQDHVATYYPYGFVIKAPKQCILSTHPKDQAFKNYRAQDAANPMTPFEINDLTNEIRRVVANYPLKSPATILGSTTGKDGKYGYNEVTVLGTVPGPISITLESFFMKVDSNGDRYEFRKGDGPVGAFVTDDILRIMKASTLPIVKITDTSGKND